MCGISGFVYHDRERPAAPEIIKRMCDTMVHRGPDDDGFYVRGNVALGMRRLSIIDLVSGHQPISNEDGKVWINEDQYFGGVPQVAWELHVGGYQPAHEARRQQ